MESDQGIVLPRFRLFYRFSNPRMGSAFHFLSNIELMIDNTGANGVSLISGCFDSGD
jgi:hypothetical protein